MVLRGFACARSEDTADHDWSNALREDMKAHACKFTSSDGVKSNFHTETLLSVNVFVLCAALTWKLN
jgi:hypothetical protein